MTDQNKDMGHDGNYVSQDAFGYSLSYFNNDYHARHIGDMQMNAVSDSGNTDGTSLFNGNINRMITTLRDTKEVVLPTQANLYSYDQLNRIFGMTSQKVVQTEGTLNFTESYHNDFTYDRNGNLMTLFRNAPEFGTGFLKEMDQFSYNYIPFTNKLDHIKDFIGAANFGNVTDGNPQLDVDDQIDNNYRYDAIGQLTQDSASNIRKITCVLTVR
ncbi:hypothetical protein [Flavobacterium sp. 3HN19-14]|uniref:hypothetical protein n=1 Tax=Flavobacterium sp. 3HN19-14 TaxID=3448133 RepID=UPI003EE296A3